MEQQKPAEIHPSIKQIAKVFELVLTGVTCPFLLIWNKTIFGNVANEELEALEEEGE
jgi:transcriptional accessory protein Tex/SPT6